MRLMLSALLFAGLALPAGAPAGFHYWSAAELKGFSKTLAPKINSQKLANQNLGGFGNYNFLMIHREGTGQFEIHETQADIMVVETGGATLLYGGHVTGGKTTAPHEIRADAATGTMERKLGPGDVITIPPKIPHQVKLEPGQEITYLTVKVTQ
ncbi:MAG TPA: AraC family ligand binding domain-containing protein [Bryobacteraceae bacterium]|nr:AraC family ligand binding domain-containing protein [Bryobacteraceae bacterium]